MDIKSLFLGFFLGIIFIFLLFSLTIYLTNKRFLQKCMETATVENETIRQIIAKKQNQIIKSTRLGISNNMSLMQDLTKELIYEIAKYYYPNSKNPQLEISFIEAIDMNERILQRLKQILDFKVISFLKNVRISQIVYILETKKQIESNKIYQFSKKFHVDKVISYGIAALNIANPAYWIRRFIFTSTLETTLRSIAVMTINIVGEEAHNLYSKKIIDNSDKILEKELAKFIKEIEAS